jgi:tellurite resistance protein TerA
MTLRTGGTGDGVPLPTAVVRLEFGRRTGARTPRAHASALLLALDRPAPAVVGVVAAVGGHGSAHTAGAVRHEGSHVNDGMEIDTLVVDLAALESGVSSVQVVAVCDGEPPEPVPGMWLRVGAAGGELARATYPEAAGASAYVLGECYRHGAGWRFRAVGERWAPPDPVTLTEDRPAVRLAASGTSGALRLGLDWRAPYGLWGANGGVSLDLCALFELSDGSAGVVQPLGGALGDLHRPPFILLGGPGEAGEAGDAGPGEHLTVNLDHLAHFRRVLVFVTIHRGAPSFAGLRATVALRPARGPRLDFAVQECGVPATVCALALLTRDGPDLVVRREARFLVPHRGVSPQRTVDYAYGWGLAWTPGRR